MAAYKIPNLFFERFYVYVSGGQYTYCFTHTKNVYGQTAFRITQKQQLSSRLYTFDSGYKRVDVLSYCAVVHFHSATANTGGFFNNFFYPIY